MNSEFEQINHEIDNEANGTDVQNGRSKVSASKSLDVIIADSDSELEYKKRLFSMERGPSSYNQMLKHGLIVKPEEIVTRVREYANMKISQFLLAFQDPFDLRALELFADAVKVI